MQLNAGRPVVAFQSRHRRAPSGHLHHHRSGDLVRGADLLPGVGLGGAANLNSVYPRGSAVAIASNAPGSPHFYPLTAVVEKSLVQHYYESILRRPPDQGGREFWR